MKLPMMLIAASTLLLLGQKPPDKPFPPAVAKATTAYGAELRQVQQEYAQKVADANKRYVEALDAAVKDATKAADLPLANRLQSLKDDALNDLVRDQALPKVLADRMFLADMEELDGGVALGGLGKKGRAGENKIIVDKRYAPNGLYMHPPAKSTEAHASFRLNGQCKTFKAGVAINDSSGGAGSPLTFKVFGDGVPLWKSKPIQKRGDTDVCSISVAGVRTLRLVVEPAGDIVSAHAVWIEPQVWR